MMGRDKGGRKAQERDEWRGRKLEHTRYLIAD